MATGLRKIVSGGQTGVDRGALDAALGAGFPCGGWCPRNRLAEDGEIPSRYPLEEAPIASYAIRTRWNVRDSSGTLILTRGPLTGGTALTHRTAIELGRPTLVVDLESMAAADVVVQLRDWLDSQQIEILNVAGPRESTAGGIQQQTHAIMTELLRRVRQEERGRADKAEFTAHRSASPVRDSRQHSAATQLR